MPLNRDLPSFGEEHVNLRKSLDTSAKQLGDLEGGAAKQCNGSVDINMAAKGETNKGRIRTGQAEKENNKSKCGEGKQSLRFSSDAFNS
ncbi:hypothetical protein CDL15_Pgr000294 [Punica granatum]|uniref:Uncharacterized protein n=1 Tax=Punica granatum TaxID=22663 RepID=A0A218Y2P0_PUNGR|nr:hypothetical protein CDL15_Pgr000294 [Punica granatum]